jgi:hypothetical protein
MVLALNSIGMIAAGTVVGIIAIMTTATVAS